MTIKIAKCEACGKEDVTGYVTCVDKQLCPECASPYVVVEPKPLRQFLQASLNKEEA